MRLSSRIALRRSELLSFHYLLVPHNSGVSLVFTQYWPSMWGVSEGEIMGGRAVSSLGLQKIVSRFLSVTVGVALSSVLAASPAVGAPVSDPCGLLTQHEISKAFGFTDTVLHKSVLRDVGNSAGVIHIRCLVVSWSGGKLGGPKQRREKILAGTSAKMRIESWVPDSSPFAQTWQRNFATKVDGLTSRARATFVEGPLHGAPFSLPRFGAERRVAYQGTTTRLHKIRAIWWSPSTSAVFSVSLLEARGKPAIASLKQVVAPMVPAVMQP